MYNKKLWTPIRTKPRQEKKLTRYCAANNIPYYLPLIQKSHSYGNRKATFSSPMFSGYVFCRINETLFSKLQLSNTIVYKITTDEHTERTLIQELKAIRVFERISNSYTVEISPDLVVGTPVEITKGLFQGITGIVQRRKNKLVLKVMIELLGQSATVEISADDLEKQ